MTIGCGYWAQATILMALLQPAPEVYALFDDIMLLAEGHIVYFGPKEEVRSFEYTADFCFWTALMLWARSVRGHFIRIEYGHVLSDSLGKQHWISY